MAPNKTYELKAVFTAEDNSGKAVNSMAARLKKLEDKLDKMNSNLNVRVTETGLDEVEDKLEDLEKRTKGVKTAKVKAEYDGKATEKKLTALEKQIGAITGSRQMLEFGDNTEAIKRNVKALEGQLNTINRAAWKIRLGDNTEEVKSRAAGLNKYVDDTFKEIKNVKIGLEKRDFDSKLGESMNRLGALTDRPHEAELGADISSFNRSLAEVKHQLNDEIGRVHRLEVRAEAKGFTQVEAQAREVRQQLESLRDAKITLETSGFQKAQILAGATARAVQDMTTKRYKIEIDTSSMSRAKLAMVGLSQSLAMFTSHLMRAGSISQDFAKAVYIAQQGMYVFRIAILAVALGALGPLVAGLSIVIFSLGALAGGLGLAAMAAAPLVKAFAEQEQNATKLKSAQEGLKASSEGVRQANEGLASSQRNVIDTQRQGVESINSAIQANKEAQRGVIDAQRAVGEAHRGVGEAILSREESITSAVQAHKDAVEAVGEAIISRRESIQAAYEAQADAVRAFNDAVISRKEGITSAIEAHGDALRNVRDAQLGVMNAQDDLIKAQKDSAQATKEFNYALSEEKYRIQDLKYEIQGLSIDSRELALDLADAREELANATDPEERERAQLQVERLMLREKQLTEEQRQATNRLTEAQRNGTQELKSAAEAREQAMREQHNAQRQVTDAERQFQKARFDAWRAEQDISKARADGDRQVADARKGMIKAEQDIAKARREGDKQVADAREAAMRAEKDILKARRDGDKQVADAQRQVAEANRGLIEANRKVMESERDIGKARADAARANQEALRGMAEAQRALLDAQQKHKTALQEVQALMQKTTGVTAAVLVKAKELGAAYRTSFKEATDSAGLLAIRMMDLGIRIMPQLGRTANETILGIDRGLTKVGQNYRAHGVLNSMKNILRNMPGITNAWTVAFGNFGGAFLNIMSQAMPYALRFALYIGRVGERFMRWTDSAEGRREIKQFFDSAAPVARALFRQIGRIGGALLKWSTENPEAVAAAITKIGDIVMGAARWISRAVRFWNAMPGPIREVIKWAGLAYVAFRMLPIPLRLAVMWIGRLALGMAAGGGAMGMFGNKTKGAAGKTSLLKRAAAGAAAAVGAKGLAGKLRGAGTGMGTLATKSAKTRKEMRTMRGAAQKGATSLSGKAGLAGAAGAAGTKLGGKGLGGTIGSLSARIGGRFIPVLGTAWIALDALSVASGNGLLGVEDLRKGVGKFASFVGLKVPEAGTEFMWLRAVIAVAGDKIKAKLKQAFKPIGGYFQNQWQKDKKNFGRIANWLETAWSSRVGKAIRGAFLNPMKGNQNKSMEQIRGVARKIFKGWQPEIDKKMRETNKSVKNKSRKTAQDGAKEYGKFPKGVGRHNQTMNRNIQQEMAKARREVLAETGTIKSKGAGNIRGFGNQSGDVMRAYARMVNTETKIAREHGIHHTGKMKGVSLQNIKDLNNDGRINMRELEAGITLQTKQARDNSNKHMLEQKRKGVEHTSNQNKHSAENMKKMKESIDFSTNKAKEKSNENTKNMKERGITFNEEFRRGSSKVIAEAAYNWARSTREGAIKTSDYLSDMSKGVKTVAENLGITWEGLAKATAGIPVIGAITALGNFLFGGEQKNARGGTYESRYAQGGKRQAPTGGVANGTTRVYGEVPGTKEYYITDNPRYRKRNMELLADANQHMMARSGGTYKANKQRNAPPGPQHWDRTPATPNARRHADQMANRRGRQEGFGPAMYTLVEPLKRIADNIAGKYGLSWNTYSNHPPGMGPQPFYRERSVDWWGSGGRGDPIGSVWTKVANDAVAQTGPDFDYMLTPGNDPAGHWDHVHLTAFTGKHGLKTATGSGQGPDVQALIDKHIPKVPDMGVGVVPEMQQKVMKKAREEAVKKIKANAPTGNWDGSGDVNKWAKEGLTLGGAFPASEANIKMIVSRAMQESGGNPNAVNDWDSNAAAGTPSKGLMQVIEPTWNSNTTDAIGQFAENWSNPIKSVAVASRYMKSQYGHIVGANGSGYTHGGIAAGPQLGMLGDNGPETMIPLDDPRAVTMLSRAFEKSRRVKASAVAVGNGRNAIVHKVNEMPDNRRFKLGRSGQLPPAPPGYTYAEDFTIVPNSFYGGSKGVAKQSRVNKATSRVFSKQNVRQTTRNGGSNSQVMRTTQTQGGDAMTAKEIKRMTDRLEAKLDEQLDSIKIANMDKIIELAVKTALGTMLSKGGRDAIDKQLADKMEFDLGLKGIL